MKKWNALVALASFSFFSLTFSSTSYAFHRAGAASFSFGEGHYSFDPKRHIDNTSIPFVALGYDLTEHWGAEALVSIFTTDQDNSTGNNQQVDGALFLLDAVYHFSPFKLLQPYVLAGVGILGLNPNGNEAHNQGNLNAGIGTELFASKSIAFRVEARDIHTTAGGKNDVLVDGGVAILFDIG